MKWFKYENDRVFVKGACICMGILLAIKITIVALMQLMQLIP